MLRVFLIIGLMVIVGGALLGFILGLAGGILVFLLKLLLVGAVVYFALRVISPRTAKRLRQSLDRESFPKY